MRRALWIAAAISLGMTLACSGLVFPDPQVQFPQTFPYTPTVVAPDLHLTELEPGVEFAEVTLADPAGTDAADTLWIYKPTGVAQAPVVVIAPAGTSLLTGMPLGQGDRPEHMPYVRAGMIVVAYSLDGHGETVDAMAEFAQSVGGVVNGRAALDVALALPQADTSRVFAVGHSSASSVAWLLAAHDNRVTGVVSYNGDGEGCWYQDVGLLTQLSWEWPGLVDFCQTTRPLSYPVNIRLPAYIFGSDDDYVVSGDDVRALAEGMRAGGVVVTEDVGSHGDHYSSMLYTGVPSAIDWMTALPVP